ncbi:MAG: Fic family protein [Candidatus Ancaeobacter aquaticus]|nr:Fic family protein [Candidatus Ancaeobacter aquaticus]
MKSLQKEFIENILLPADLISKIRKIGEYKGREDLYIDKIPYKSKQKLMQGIIVQNACGQYGIKIPYRRVQKIVSTDHPVPHTKNEKIVTGYKDLITFIYKNSKEIKLTENTILELHSMLFHYVPNISSGTWRSRDQKSKDLYIKVVANNEIPFYIKKLVGLYIVCEQMGVYDSLLLIPLFILDFIIIQPFKYGNDKISRLLMLLLLYQSHYNVVRYSEIETIMNKLSDKWKSTIMATSKNWIDGHHDVIPWLNMFYDTLISIYSEFEYRVAHFDGKGSKTDLIKAHIRQISEPFSMNDLQKRSPHITRDMIRKVVRELRDEKKIQSTGIGRNAKWIKV